MESLPPSPSPLPSPARVTKPNPKPKPTLFHKAATFCWLSPLIAVAVNMAKPPFGGVVLILGVAAGVVALCGIPKHGAKGLLLRAIVGLTLIAFLFVSAYYSIKMVNELQRRAAEEAKAEPPKQEQKK